MAQVAKVHTALSRDRSAIFARSASASPAPQASIQNRATVGRSLTEVGQRLPGRSACLADRQKAEGFPNNETRGHMLADLGRYFFAALYGRIAGISPKAKIFPRSLAPDHRNWNTGKFADRFRVQLWNAASDNDNKSYFERTDIISSIPTRPNAGA